MNIAFEENPYLGVNTNVVSDGGYRVAKMSASTKVPTLKARWESELAKIVKPAAPVQEVVTEAPKVSLMDKLDLTMADYYSEVSSISARKLKVNPVVVNKSKNAYGVREAVVLKKEEPVKVEPIVNEVPLTREEVHKEETADTRMSRLERTGEIPTVEENREVTMKRETPSINSNVINTPTRFERHNEPTPFDALINDNAGVHAEKENVEVANHSNERTGGDPNLYTKLIHGDNDISKRLEDARNKLSTANEEREKARAVNASLEAEVANVRRTIEELKRKQDEKAEQELNNTLNMLQTTKEEILGETRKYDNLQEELAELLRQRDSLMNGNNYSGEDGFSRSSRM